MRNILIISSMLFLTLNMIAQAPNAFNFQAMALDDQGAVYKNHNVEIRVSLREDTPDGNSIYVEQHSISTSDIGIFNLTVGNGVQINGSMSAALWGLRPYWLQIEADFEGNGFQDLGTQPLNSVPYAMHATTVTEKDDADADPQNEIQSLSLSGNQLSLTRGGSVTLPSGGGAADKVVDGDNDTRIEVDNADDDVIRFYTNGNESMRLIENEHGAPRLEIEDFFDNTFIGNFAGYRSFATLFGGGGHNTFIGSSAGQDNVAGSQNTFVGSKAGQSNTEGLANTAIGFESLVSNVEGRQNTAVGAGAIKSAITADGNTAVGRNALTSNTSGEDNVAIGHNALYSNSTESQLVAVGVQACESCTGYRGTAVGYHAMRDNVGYQNTAIGHSALGSQTEGDNNVAVGVYTMYDGDGGSDNVAVGNIALNVNEGNGNTAIGTASMQSNVSGENNTAIGLEAMKRNDNGINNVSVGANSLINNTSGSWNVAMGYGALYENKTQGENVAIGLNALRANGTTAEGGDEGQRNTAVGVLALTSNDVGYDNTALGHHALMSSYSATRNTAVGAEALRDNEYGYANTAIGAGALEQNISGETNTALGHLSLRSNEDGFRNTATGHWSLTSNTSGDYNVAMGAEALFSNTWGSFNTAVGYAANSSAEFLENTTAVGYGTSCTASNQVRIGNSSVTSIGGYVNWTKVSDGRFKKEVHENVKGLSFINALRPVTYLLDQNAILNWQNENLGTSDLPETGPNEIVQSGFIAQEVEEVADRLGYDFSGVDVPKNGSDYYGLSYAEFVVPLVKAVQELSEINRQQQSIISKLEERLSVLENQ